MLKKPAATWIGWALLSFCAAGTALAMDLVTCTLKNGSTVQCQSCNDPGCHDSIEASRGGGAITPGGISATEHKTIRPSSPTVAPKCASGKKLVKDGDGKKDVCQ